MFLEALTSDSVHCSSNILKLQKAMTLKSVFCIANAFNFMKISNLLTLINQASLTEKEDFQQMWASNLLICFFCYNPAISVPRISKLVIRCIAALTLLKLQESYKH